MFSLVCSEPKIKNSLAQNEPLKSTQGAGPLSCKDDSNMATGCLTENSSPGA